MRKILIFILLLASLSGFSQFDSPIYHKLRGDTLLLLKTHDSLWEIKLNASGDTLSINGRKFAGGGGSGGGGGDTTWTDHYPVSSQQSKRDSVLSNYFKAKYSYYIGRHGQLLNEANQTQLVDSLENNYAKEILDAPNHQIIFTLSGVQGGHGPPPPINNDTLFFKRFNIYDPYSDAYFYPKQPNMYAGRVSLGHSLYPWDSAYFNNLNLGALSGSGTILGIDVHNNVIRTSGGTNYWQRTSTTLSPTTAQDNLQVYSNQYTTGDFENTHSGSDSAKAVYGYIYGSNAAPNYAFYATASGGSSNYSFYGNAGMFLQNDSSYFGNYLRISPISAPSPVTDKLYNVGHSLYWNGSALGTGTGSVTNITMGYGLSSTQSPLTTTGTMKADSTVLASKPYVTTYTADRFQTILGFTPENITNKSNVTGTSTVKYATQNLVKTYADSIKTTIPAPTTYTATLPVVVTGTVVSLNTDSLASLARRKDTVNFIVSKPYLTTYVANRFLTLGSSWLHADTAGTLASKSFIETWVQDRFQQFISCTNPIQISGSTVSIRTDTLTSWRTKMNQGAYSFANGWMKGDTATLASKSFIETYIIDRYQTIIGSHS